MSVGGCFASTFNTVWTAQTTPTGANRSTAWRETARVLPSTNTHTQVETTLADDAHSDNCIQLSRFPRMRRMVRERKGERVRWFELFNIVSLALLAAMHKRLKAAVGNLFGGSIVKKNHRTNEQRQGGPLVSMCWSAGTGSSVLDPFPSVVVASLRAVDHRCCTPLRVKLWWKRW